MSKYKIMFVCLGNICRSPMAEGVMRGLVAKAGRLDEFLIESAGTGGWHVGNPPDPGAQAATGARGIDISSQRCRKFCERDFAAFDLLIAMDRQNKKRLLDVASDADASKVKLLLAYAAELSEAEVPDPWCEGGDAFDHALDLIEAGCAGLLNSLPSTSR